MARKVELRCMSFKEVEAVDRSKAVLLLPIGVLEQHGPGGPMGADNVLAERVAVETAARLPEVYVAPTITYGYSPTFQHFAGNLGMPFEVVKAHLRAVVERLIACGWRNILYVNGHQGNDPACEQVAREMRTEHGVVMGQLVPWRIAMHVAKDLYTDWKVSFGHGAEPTISVMMALFGDDVRKDLLVADRVKTLGGFEKSNAKSVTLDGFEVGFYLETEIFTTTGTSADPAEASPEKGQKILDRVVDFCTRFVPRYHSLVLNKFDERGRYLSVTE